LFEQKDRFKPRQVDGLNPAKRAGYAS